MSKETEERIKPLEFLAEMAAREQEAYERGLEDAARFFGSRPHSDYSGQQIALLIRRLTPAKAP
jgi:hypothetical protein